MILIDADILVYRIGFKTNEETVEHAYRTVDSMLSDILMVFPECTDYQCFLTGKGNFREYRAVTAPYKGNRGDKEKPVHYNAIREYMIDAWKATVVDNMEADDAIAMAMTASNGKGCICSIDKDFDQVPGAHYNFVKRSFYDVSEEDATRFLYEQILTGDRVDNIIGLKGIGPVKANKILEGCETEVEMFNACVKAYEKMDSSPHSMARVVENANLLYLLRKEGEHWTIPT